jgi:serine/threonine protein kinase
MDTGNSAIAPDDLGKTLQQLGLVSESQWQQALARAGQDGKLSVVLDILTRTPAIWAPAETGIRSTALTAHQVRQIERCLKENALPKLPRLLRWNNYFILDPIGKGGMGVVYKGWDVEHRRYVAIKRTHRDSPEVRKRLKREAKLQQFLDHPNIAKLYSREKYGNTDLLVLEYLPGNTLAEIVHKRGREKPLPWQFVAEMAADLLDALDHAHGNNRRNVTIIHRDIKPGNIMLMRQKVQGVDKYIPKLLDMGLAKSMATDDQPAAARMVSVDEQLTRQFQILGTPEYMAPEQWEGGLSAIPESDIYCLGGTLFFALTAEAPFQGVNKGNKMTYFAEMCHKHSAEPRPSVRKKRPDVPVEIDRLLQQMMAVPPSHRGKCLELRDRFRELLSSLAPVSSHTGPASSRPVAGAAPPSGRLPASASGPASQSARSDRTSAPASTEADSMDPLAQPESAVSSAVASSRSSDRQARSPASSARMPRSDSPVRSPRPLPKIDDEELEAISVRPGSGDDVDDDEAAARPLSARRLPSVKLDALSDRAKILFDPSREGEREREATIGALLAWLRGLIRPARQPISVTIIVAVLGLTAAFLSVSLAVFLAIVLLMAIGFAFVSQPRRDD